MKLCEVSVDCVEVCSTRGPLSGWQASEPRTTEIIKDMTHFVFGRLALLDRPLMVFCVFTPTRQRGNGGNGLPR
jgi:hypothetical protein